MNLSESLGTPSLTAQDWHHRICFGCGPDNPHGLGADFRFDEDNGEVRFSYTPGPFLTGAPGFVHGGILASIMDEAQGVLCFHIGHIVMTEQLTLKYHRATPLEKAFQVRAWITSVRRRRMYTRATIHEGETLLVSSRAAWYLLPERVVRRMIHTEEQEFERIRGVVEANRKRARQIRQKLRRARRN
ncbi:MAG: PaaI family thioesterase [Spirochaetales bacterium]|nr:PaaI family thioesterase [Leptospiraceae bacterium]MCP5482252.1 PaaI family thioesterase [Spirochaetales bacterium]MCP5484636.1 PaaI family thioesterase [Spirochaetales bacterium]